MKTITLFLKRLHFKLGIILFAEKEDGIIYASWEAEMWTWFNSDTRRWVFEKGNYEV